MIPYDHMKLNKAKCLLITLLICYFSKFKVIELLTQLKIVAQKFKNFNTKDFCEQKNIWAKTYDL